MIYLFSGEDIKSKLASHEKFIKSLPKGIEVFSIGKNDFDFMQIESFYSGSGLFSPKSAIVFTNIFEREDIRDFILEHLGDMEKSENYFIFSEGKLLKPMLDAFKKAGVKPDRISIFDAVGTKGKTEKFNSFLLANAFGSKDKLNLWIYFRQAMDKGVSLEELSGVLFWKAKDMLIKQSYGKFSEPELKDFASRLAYLLPEARSKGRDAEEAFEVFLLEAF